MSHHELLDVVSEHDEVIEQKTRNFIYANNLYFRVINAFVCNAEKKLLIPRRHPDKKLFPLHLDCSVGGHVSAGEDYDTAFIRETKEELNITLTKDSYKKVARLTPQKHGVSAFMWVYLIYTDAEPLLNQDDFIEHYWLTPDQIKHQLDMGDKAKSDLPLILQEIKDII